MFEKLKPLILIALLVGGSIVCIHAEDALRDGNRNPTLLFDQSGQPKRVSNITPLPVVVSGQQGASQVTIVNPSTSSIPVRIVGSTVPVVLVSPSTPIPVAVTNQISSMSVTMINPSTFTFASITNPVLPVSISTPAQVTVINPVSSMTILNPSTFTYASITNTVLPVSVSTPLAVTVLNQTSTMTVVAGNVFPVLAVGAFPITSSMTINVAAPNPIQVIEMATVTVKAITPLPVHVVSFSVGSQTHVSERSGSGTFTLITPAAGKSIVIRGVTVTASASGDVDVRFSGGVVTYKAYLTTQMGPFVPVMKTGAVNEAVQGVVSSVGGGTRITFMINYDEL